MQWTVVVLVHVDCWCMWAAGFCRSSPGFFVEQSGDPPHSLDFDEKMVSIFMDERVFQVKQQFSPAAIGACQKFALST